MYMCVYVCMYMYVYIYIYILYTTYVQLYIYIYIHIYLYTHIQQTRIVYIYADWARRLHVDARQLRSGCDLLRTAVVVQNMTWKRDSTHHNLPDFIFETATVLELRQQLVYTTPSGSGWLWWCIKSLFRMIV